MRPRPLFPVALLLACLSMPSEVGAQFSQQGAKLVGSGGASPSRQGTSVAVSGDGNTLVTGAYIDNSSQGAAWLFVRNFGVWAQQGSKLVGTGGLVAQQGTAVAIATDGNTVAVGGPSDVTQGAVWVFVRNSGSWFQEGAKLVGTGSSAARQGSSLALSADGNTLAVGGREDNILQGAVWVFVRSGGVWSQQGAKLVGTGAVGAARQGTSVALSADGNTLLVGGNTDNTNQGAVWVFTRSGGVWTQQGSKLVGTGALGNANQGTSAAISSDGNTAVVGGNQDNGGQGATWVFTRSGGVWTQDGSKLVGVPATGSALQGTSVSVAGNGRTIIVGGNTEGGGVGAAWTFVRSGDVWTQPDVKLVGIGAVGNAAQGYSVSLSADGGTAVVGGWVDNTNVGATWTFVRSTPTIVSVTDVRNDQGGRVNIRWNASPADTPPGYPIAAYWVWRQVPAWYASKSPAANTEVASRDHRPFEWIRQSVMNGQTYYWEFVGSQPAHHHEGYSYSAPTLSDSVPGSNPYTLFMVEAEESATGEFWPSEPDSGYSVDNLPPGPPAPVAAVYSSGITHLHWGVSPEFDFAFYRVYRGHSAGFVPGPANLVVAQPDTGYGDPGPAGRYYKLSAVDVHGNESAFALITPNRTLDVPGQMVAKLALSPVAPNPMLGDGAFRYSLLHETPATLAIHDVHGRRVRVVASGLHPAGEHTARWDGRDAGGNGIRSGVYFLRLDAAGKSVTSRFLYLN